MAKYICPHCRAQLNVGNDIVFTVKTPDKHAGLFLVSPQVGDYSVKKDMLFNVKKGEHLEILCPVCHMRLQVNEICENLAMILMVDENFGESKIYFSEVFGEHCTYKITKDKHVEIYGDDSGSYNFFGASPNFYH